MSAPIRPLALVGMMGSGKTSVAALIGTHCGWDWWDLDHLIEEAAGMAVPEIFSLGETVFRDWETRVLRDVVGQLKTPSVLATGGGAPLVPANRVLLRDTCCIVWLDASADMLYDRAFGPSRPLTQGGREAFRTLVASRRTLYKGVADWVVDVGHTTLEETAQRILDWYGA